MCYNCGNSDHIAANCPKGKGKGAPVNWINPGKGNAGTWSGQWNVGAVQSAPVAANNQIDNSQTDISPPVWDNSNQQNDADLGGNSDATLAEVSRDSQWAVVARRARGNGDMIPIRLAGIVAQWEIM